MRGNDRRLGHAQHVPHGFAGDQVANLFRQVLGVVAGAFQRLRHKQDVDSLGPSGAFVVLDVPDKQQIADKQKSLDEAKQKLTDMQEEARKAGMPNSVTQQ